MQLLCTEDAHIILTMGDPKKSIMPEFHSSFGHFRGQTSEHMPTRQMLYTWAILHILDTISIVNEYDYSKTQPPYSLFSPNRFFPSHHLDHRGKNRKVKRFSVHSPTLHTHTTKYTVRRKELRETFKTLLSLYWKWSDFLWLEKRWTRHPCFWACQNLRMKQEKCRKFSGILALQT